MTTTFGDWNVNPSCRGRSGGIVDPPHEVPPLDPPQPDPDQVRHADRQAEQERQRSEP